MYFNFNNAVGEGVAVKAIGSLHMVTGFYMKVVINISGSDHISRVVEIWLCRRKPSFGDFVHRNLKISPWT